MIAGEGVQAEVRNYAAVSMELNTRDEIYSAMVVYGLLTCINGKVYIPNREIMEQFKNLLMSKESLGYVYNLAKESEKMVKATLAGNTQMMAEILKYALRFQGKTGEKPKYTGRILAVGISYSRKTKEHFCKIEELRQENTLHNIP